MFANILMKVTDMVMALQSTDDEEEQGAMLMGMVAGAIPEMLAALPVSAQDVVNKCYLDLVELSNEGHPSESQREAVVDDLRSLAVLFLNIMPPEGFAKVEPILTGLMNLSRSVPRSAK